MKYKKKYLKKLIKYRLKHKKKNKKNNKISVKYPEISTIFFHLPDICMDIIYHVYPIENSVDCSMHRARFMRVGVGFGCGDTLLWMIRIGKSLPTRLTKWTSDQRAQPLHYQARFLQPNIKFVPFSLLFDSNVIFNVSNNILHGFFALIK